MVFTKKRWKKSLPTNKGCFPQTEDASLKQRMNIISTPNSLSSSWRGHFISNLPPFTQWHGRCPHCPHVSSQFPPTSLIFKAFQLFPRDQFWLSGYRRPCCFLAFQPVTLQNQCWKGRWFIFCHQDDRKMIRMEAREHWLFGQICYSKKGFKNQIKQHHYHRERETCTIGLSWHHITSYNLDWSL